jgi:hypothetical protein
LEKHEKIEKEKKEKKKNTDGIYVVSWQTLDTKIINLLFSEMLKYSTKQIQTNKIL